MGNHQILDSSNEWQTMIDQGSSLAISNNRFSLSDREDSQLHMWAPGNKSWRGQSPGPDPLDEQLIDALEFDLTSEDSERSNSELGHE